ncbi:unnamed protein product [Hydatigera taeniaeformis]|uniref:ADP-ribosylation factor-related protein 1 n=1 Tax=Hydatigena taeniaeformis TaxID=6205 RepID=A0A0R3WHK4_HYDTA|nr:unnamed protein product [Hydatigera taeniaeformis]
MYTLIRGFCRQIIKKDEYSVLILGLDQAGKTTYLEQAKTKFNDSYRSIPPHKITSTVGLNIGHIVLDGIIMKFWDLGGQTELQSLWDKYYIESHGVIFIIDSSDPDRFNESKAAFGNCHLDKMIQNHALRGVPLLIIANKQDLDVGYHAPDHFAFPVSEVRQVFQNSAHLIGSRDCSMRGSSALKGDGVIDAIRWMAEKMKKNSLQRPPNVE